MSTVELLLDNAREDTNLLIKNDELGDNFSTFRDVDFYLYAQDEKKAQLVADFIYDNRYAETSVDKVDEQYRIRATVNMPTTQNVLCSISGLMACVSKLFGIEYDGWETPIKNNTQPEP